MKPGRARAAVNYLCDSYRISIRRACRAYPLDRSTYHYRSRRPDQAPLRERIREIAKTRVRYGYRRVHILLRREGWAINHKRTRRLYREEGLQLRNKNPKRKVAAKLREDRVMATAPNECWAMDFLDDARCKVEAWRVEYNSVRPHSAIGHVPPAEHAQSLAAACSSQIIRKPDFLVEIGPALGPGTLRVRTRSIPGDLEGLTSDAVRSRP